MKHEWKKQEKNLYLSKDKPELITVPQQKFFTITGKGNPNDIDFSDKVSVLYSLSYAIRMMCKKGLTPLGSFEYTVYPLEGIWDLTKEGRNSDTFDKNELLYTIMIRQPDFLTHDIAYQTLDNVRKKKPHPLFDEVMFQTIEDGLSVQMLHIGSYNEEPRSFEKMKAYIKENNYELRTLKHREIYLSDARKTEKSKLKTILRYMVNYQTEEK